MSMRPLDKVVDAIQKLVPVDYENAEVLNLALDSIKESYLYAAPEMVSDVWVRLGSVLGFYLVDENLEWQNKIALLMQAKLDYKEVLNA